MLRLAQRLIVSGRPAEEVNAPGKPFSELDARRVIECRSSRKAVHVKVDRVLLQPCLIAPVCHKPTGAFKKRPARTIFHSQDHNPLDQAGKPCILRLFLRGTGFHLYRFMQGCRSFFLSTVFG